MSWVSTMNSFNFVQQIGTKRNTFKVYRNSDSCRFTVYLRDKSRKSLVMVDAAMSYNPNQKFQTAQPIIAFKMLKILQEKVLKTVSFDDSFRLPITKTGNMVSRGKGVVSKSARHIEDM